MSKRKELIIGQIPDDFNPDIHIPISPSCFIGKEYIYPNFEDLDYSRVITDKEELKRFDKFCAEEALYWVNIVAEKYNPAEFDKHSFLFWKTIYYPWLGIVLPWIYRKQILVSKILEKYGNKNIKINLFSMALPVRFLDELDFINNGIRNININKWVLSRIIEKKASNKWDVNYKKFNSDINTNSINNFEKHNKFRNVLIKRLRRLTFRTNHVYGFNYFNEILFQSLFYFKQAIKGKEPQYKSVTEKYNVIDNNLLKIIDELIPESLRNLKINNYRRKYKKGKLVNYSNRLYYDVNAKINAALAREKGEIVIATQHGGHNYGSAYTYTFGNEVEYKLNYFLSWGWKEKRFNIIKLPSPLLSKKLNSHKYRNNDILLVGTQMSGFPSKIESWPSELSFLEYRRNKINFLNALNNNCLKNILYRPYPEKRTSFLDSDYVIENVPKIKIHKGDLHHDMKRCSVLILDHPGTTWNIAMAMNTPTICFWNREHFPFNNLADSYLDKFQKLDLFFDKPQDAAAKVNSLTEKYSDLTQWWNQKEIQDLRKEWMWKYARADKNWFWIWTKTLWNLK